MIDGITILSQEPVIEEPLWFWIIIIICLIIIFIGFILIFIDLGSLGTLLAAISVFIIILLYIASPLIQNKFGIPTGQYEYKVLIDDNEVFKKIYDKYDIIDNEGLIYIIRDK